MNHSKIVAFLQFPRRRYKFFDFITIVQSSVHFLEFSRLCFLMFLQFTDYSIVRFWLNSSICLLPNFSYIQVNASLCQTMQLAYKKGRETATCREVKAKSKLTSLKTSMKGNSISFLVFIRCHRSLCCSIL